jgi:hypothetical protein
MERDSVDTTVPACGQKEGAGAMPYKSKHSLQSETFLNLE